MKAASLKKKFWVKRSSARREQRRAYEATVADMEAEMERALDIDETSSADEVEVRSVRRGPHPHATSRSKARRMQRRDARDRKCFAFNDPVESAALDATADSRQPTAVEKKRRKLREALPVAHHQTSSLIFIESKGAPLKVCNLGRRHS